MPKVLMWHILLSVLMSMSMHVRVHMHASTSIVSRSVATAALVIGTFI